MYPFTLQEEHAPEIPPASPILTFPSYMTYIWCVKLVCVGTTPYFAGVWYSCYFGIWAILNYVKSEIFVKYWNLQIFHSHHMRRLVQSWSPLWGGAPSNHSPDRSNYGLSLLKAKILNQMEPVGPHEINKKESSIHLWWHTDKSWNTLCKRRRFLPDLFTWVLFYSLLQMINQLGSN